MKKRVEGTAVIQWHQWSPDSFLYRSPAHRRGDQGIVARLGWDEAKRAWFCEIEMPRKRVHVELFPPTVGLSQKRLARDMATETLFVLMLERLGG